jgi:hypothetical protein
MAKQTVYKPPSGSEAQPQLADFDGRWLVFSASLSADYPGPGAQYGATVAKGDALGVGYPEDGTGTGSSKSDINYVLASDKLPPLPTRP